MPGFIQTVTFRTSRIDEVRQLAEGQREKRTAAGDTDKPISVSICADRDTPDQYTVVIEFASYEAAMANSNHPDTQEMSQQMAKLCDGPPTFANLDVLDQHKP